MPQGSVVGPFGFPIYSAPVGKICEKHRICHHFYADDSQLYLAFKPGNEVEARSKLKACIAEIREWMRANHLKLNDTKTEFLIIGSRAHLKQLSMDGIRIGDSIIQPSGVARNIGAIFDKTMSMKDHILSICRSCYCHIRNIGKVRRFLTKDAASTLIHAFVSSKLDHLNALLYGVPQYLLYKLQKIQNNSARIVMKTKSREHITPVLKGLHWLPIAERIIYKINLTTFKALNGFAPGYVRDLLRPYTPSRALRSLNASFLRKPRCRTKAGERSYAICGPHLWNRLPRNLRESVDLDRFKLDLKSHLFRATYE